MTHDDVSPAQRAFWRRQTAMRMMMMLPEDKEDAEAVLMYMRQLLEDYFGIDCDTIRHPSVVQARAMATDGNVVRMKAVD